MCEDRRDTITMMNYTTVAFSDMSVTREWRGENRQDNDLINKWAAVQKVADYKKTTMPNKNFIYDHKEITDAAAKCFDRMEKLSALSLESVNSYIIMFEAYSSPCNTVCFIDFKSLMLTS